ncbi:unnamed protein product [Discosporangium mesarthrocarpum]
MAASEPSSHIDGLAAAAAYAASEEGGGSGQQLPGASSAVPDARVFSEHREGGGHGDRHGDYRQEWVPDAAAEASLYVPPPPSLVFVQDVIEPVTRAAQAVAQSRGVSFRWRVDEDLPGVMGDERALQEALSNIVENALKYVVMGRKQAASVPGPAQGTDGERGEMEGNGRGSRPMVVLRARPSEDQDWGKGRFVHRQFVF